MSRNRAAVLAAVLVMMLMLPACALGDDLIDDSLLVPETANYDTFTVEYGDYIKPASAGGYQVFPVEQHLSVEEGTARIVKLNIARNANVKAGDVLVTYEKEGSRAELESMKNITLCENVVTIRSAANAVAEAQMDALAAELVAK